MFIWNLGLTIDKIKLSLKRHKETSVEVVKFRPVRSWNQIVEVMKNVVSAGGGKNPFCNSVMMKA